jgi:hypothetical protein
MSVGSYTKTQICCVPSSAIVLPHRPSRVFGEHYSGRLVSQVPEGLDFLQSLMSTRPERDELLRSSGKLHFLSQFLPLLAREKRRPLIFCDTLIGLKLVSVLLRKLVGFSARLLLNRVDLIFFSI